VELEVGSDRALWKASLCISFEDIIVSDLELEVLVWGFDLPNL
jgi:hypothetical protein